MYHAARTPAVEPLAAAAIIAVAMASYLVVLGTIPSPANFVIGQLALAAVAAAGTAIAGSSPLLASIGVRGAPLRSFAAAIAIGATAWYVNAWLVDWLVVHLGLPQVQIHHLKGLVDRPPLMQSLATFALLPAMCEEIVFRGVLARSLGRRYSLVVAAAVSAAVFAAYHLSPVQALPTLTLGALLAVIAIRAGSIAPAIAAHAINNAVAILMSRGELPAAALWLEHHPSAALAGCAAVTAGGLALALRAPRAG